MEKSNLKMEINRNFKLIFNQIYIHKTINKVNFIKKYN